MTFGNDVEHWIAEAKRDGLSDRSFIGLRNMYFRDGSQKDAMREIEDLAKANGLVLIKTPQEKDTLLTLRPIPGS